MAYIVSFSLGLGAIPWLIMGEIFPGHVRALSSSVATMLNWTCSFIVTETFDYVRVALGPVGTFLGFCAVCVAGFVFVAACVPETKGQAPRGDRGALPLSTTTSFRWAASARELI